MNAVLETTAPVADSIVARPGTKKILLVDDYPPIRQILARLLTEEGYQVEIAEDAMDETGIIPSTIDLVLLDLDRPFQDGWRMFQQLCLDYPLLPIILITSRPNDLSAKSTKGTGVLLDSPLDFVKLFDTIHYFLARPAEPPVVPANESFATASALHNRRN